MNPTRAKRLKTLFKSLRLYIIVIIAITILGIAYHATLQDTLLRNFQQLGTALAQSYVAEETSNLTVFETLITFGTNSINAQKERGNTDEEIESWIGTFYRQMQSVLGSSTVDPYAILNGRLIAANPWEGDATFDYQNAEWYQMAIQADGGVIFTNLYTDAISGNPVITIAQKCQDSDTVLAFDIFPQNLRVHTNAIQLPERASYFVCDSAGTLIYHQAVQKRSQEELQNYIDSILIRIQNGSLDAYDTCIDDLDGERRGVYYYAMSNGWIIIITIPFNTILAQASQFALLLGLVLCLCIGGILVVAWRDLRLSSQVERTNETVRVLGNSYFALYRIDYQNETYEMIKGSDYVRGAIPSKGPYSELIKMVGKVIPPDTFAEFQKSFSPESMRNLVARRIRDYGGDFLRKFGDEYRWVNVRILFDESLAPEEVVLCFKEVDQEKQQQLKERELLENALENARRSEKAKHAFFNNMSHDMRTPLNAILGLSQLVRQNSEDPKKVLGYIDRIYFSSRQLLDLVNDILDMSRLEQGKVILNNETFDLKKCIDDCISTFYIQAESEKKHFSVQYALFRSMVLGDSLRINQILNNLLSNAFKFTTEGDSITVAVKQFEDKEYSQYQIVVQDTGIGMSQEFLPQIFEPYSRETTFSSRQISGTGLGMPIVKNLVTQMSGQIRVDSQLGVGTTFTVTVPFTVVQEEKRTPEPQNMPAFSLKGRKILLAEDNLINMEIATEILTMNGIEIVQAWNGQEALSQFKASKPFEFDAILMDMQMPQMDGCEAAKNIRSLPRPDARTIPIIAVTANAFAEDIAATTAAGMNAHISKPIDFNILCQTLEKLLEQK